jgi:anti-sigma factor ChrR (cupin superfamily)
MQINSDLSQRVVIDSNELPWSPSPMAGVERRMLDRVPAESGRATSLVRYAPKTSFPMHGHPRACSQ